MCVRDLLYSRERTGFWCVCVCIHTYTCRKMCVRVCVAAKANTHREMRGKETSLSNKIRAVAA